MNSKASDVSEGVVSRLRELLAKATKRPWVAFDVNNTLAVMKGPRPVERRERWKEIVAWPGFDGANTPKHKRRADLHLIVEAVNALPGLLDIAEATLSPPLPSVERPGSIMLEMAAADDAHQMWERRYRELCRMYAIDHCFVDRDGKWGLRDFLEYAASVCGFAALSALPLDGGLSSD